LAHDNQFDQAPLPYRLKLGEVVDALPDHLVDLTDTIKSLLIDAAEIYSLVRDLLGLVTALGKGTPFMMTVGYSQLNESRQDDIIVNSKYPHLPNT
jgi:hypothetical protein